MRTTARASFEVGDANCVWTVGMTLRDGTHDRSVPGKHSGCRVLLGRRCGIKRANENICGYGARKLIKKSLTLRPS